MANPSSCFNSLNSVLQDIYRLYDLRLRGFPFLATSSWIPEWESAFFILGRGLYDKIFGWTSP